MPDDKRDSHDAFTGEELFEQVVPLIEPAVSNACLHYQHRAAPDDVARFSQRLYAFFLEDDYRRLLTYDGKAQLKTWLQKVVNHEILRWVKEEQRNIPLEDAPPHTFDLMPEQEALLLRKEQEHLLAEAVLHKLTTTEQTLLGLVRAGLTINEIAQEMDILKPSVSSMKRALREKLHGLLGEGRK